MNEGQGEAQVPKLTLNVLLILLLLTPYHANSDRDAWLTQLAPTMSYFVNEPRADAILLARHKAEADLRMFEAFIPMNLRVIGPALQGNVNNL